MNAATTAVEISEVGPRDGLQGLPQLVPTADTTGRGTAATVARLADRVLERVPAERLGIHFHDTFGQGLANVATCLERDIRRIDASVAGLGGCPTAQGAAGNVATGDVLLLLEGLGIVTGVDVRRVAAIGADLGGDLGLRNDSKAGRALSAPAVTGRRA
jgi:hydroxymethylglutaryl-CoA lyase